MSRRISFKVSNERWEHIYNFSKEVGMTLEAFAEQAILYAISDSVRRTIELEEQGATVDPVSGEITLGGTNGITTGGDTNRDTSEASNSEDADTGVLAESSSNTVEAPTS